MKKIFLFFSILAALLLNSNLANVFGWEDSKLTAALLLLTLFLAWEFITRNIRLSKERMPEILLLILGVLIYIFGYLDSVNLFRKVSFFIFVPYITSIYLDTQGSKYKKTLQWCIFIALAIEIGMAVYERITLEPLIADEEQYRIMNKEEDEWSFRASALYGHPLVSAMILCVINVFVLYSDFSKRFKFVALVAILVALFCFNERGNILIALLVAIVYFYRTLISIRPLFLRVMYILAIVMAVQYSYNILNETSMGGRLFHGEEIVDDSALYRLEAFSAFDELDKDILLWGFRTERVELENLTYAENGFVNILLEYGLIFGIPLIIFLSYFVFKKVWRYKNTGTLMIPLVFFGIGMTNPHLANPLQWMYFIVCYYAFRPSEFKKSLP